MNIIEVENLCFDYISYDEDGKEVGRNPVLKDVSLSVPEGQFLAATAFIALVVRLDGTFSRISAN